jgi:hypothetical protein
MAATLDLNEKVADQAAKSIAMASIASPTNSVSLHNGVKLDNTASSPFAAMMLAQMDLETFALDAKDYSFRSRGDDEGRRKSVYQTLSDIG